jgi:hypothetical protein
VADDGLLLQRRRLSGDYALRRTTAPEIALGTAIREQAAEKIDAGLRTALAG